MLKDLRRLHQLGFAIHWLHSKSKRPIGEGWTKSEKKSWEELEKSYRHGMNVGVRTGRVSKLASGYLACIDVDIKEPQYREEAEQALFDIVGFQKYPEVRSGGGNGSRHLYCVTENHFDSVTLAKSTTKITKHGRKSNAWEIVLYSDGRQMVLPPSIHPDTGKRYVWFEEVKTVIPQLRIPARLANPEKVVRANCDKEILNATNFEAVEVAWLPLPQKILDGLISGKGVEDRSAFLLPAATALLSAGLSDNEVLSVLTDRKTFLGACAYDHAKTDSRKVAARWVYRYTLQKVLQEKEASKAFLQNAEIKDVELSKEEAEAQEKELEDWRAAILRTKGGSPYTSIENVVLILQNAVRKDLVKYDLFSYREHFTLKTPWGAGTGHAVQDHDIPAIRLWLGQQWRFEPSKETITDALTVIGQQNAYDPVVDYFEHLPAWDGVRRLDSWLAENFEARGDRQYLAQVFRKWMVAMVMRVYAPGAKFDWMPIFEGVQGVGKSSFGRLLVGDRYFLDQLPALSDKDAALALQGIQAVEMGELASLRKNELEVVKAFLTRTIDKVRPPFGRKTIESARRCVFYGTTNKETYLKDESGNRRFKPVKVGQLDFEALERDRNQLFAEAKFLFENFLETEISLELSGIAKKYELQIHQEKMVKDESEIMQELILDFAEKREEFDSQKIKLTELFGVIGPLQKFQFTNVNMQFAAKALKALGGEKRHIQGRVYWKLPLG